jgi:RNA polymerase sigma-70 factor (ECF subfamily)
MSFCGVSNDLGVLKIGTGPQDTAEEDDLVEGCRQQDPDAQRLLFQRYKSRVFRLAMFISRNSADAAEITQDVFIKVYSGLPQFRGEAAFDTWLYRIVSNACRDHARKSRRFLWLDSAFWSSRANQVVPPEHGLSLEQAREVVRSAIASLPEKFRIPVVLRYVEDLSYEEISKVLGCPSGTVAARLSRAHKMLAGKLAKLRR